MSRFPENQAAPEVKQIVEAMTEHFSVIFEGFNPDGIDYICTKVKKKKRMPIKLHARTYPDIIFHSNPYIVEIFDMNWGEMDDTKKNLAVFHAMCGIPKGGFDSTTKEYAKKKQPDIKMYFMEFAASGGIPNWEDNPLAVDPLARSEKEVAADAPAFHEGIDEGEEEDPLTEDDEMVRSAVTVDGIANVGAEESEAATA
jgi:hypothetical protein